MKAQEDRGLTDNAWVERIGQLRQMVSDQYDPTTGATFNQFVDWLIENAEEEFDSADERILRRKAQDMLQDAVENRVHAHDELEAIRNLIYYEWPNQWDHMAWVASAPIAEIVDWADTVEMAAE